MYMALSKIDRFLPILACLLFLVHPAIAQQEGHADTTQCRIDLICDISGLDVWLDGVSAGQTPLTGLTVKAGTYTLRVSHPDPTDWLGRDWEQTVSLGPGETKQLTVSFPTSYWIGTIPGEAAVSIDGRYAGDTPMVLTIPPDSLEFVVVQKPGYEDYVLDSSWADASLIQIRLKQIPVDLGMDKESFRLSKAWIIAGGAVAVLCGGLGYYFKVRSDRAYEKYMRASHPEDMDRYFSEVEHFDRLTGIFYGIGEVSLGISLVLTIQGVWVR
jgi:hypothetical protein